MGLETLRTPIKKPVAQTPEVPFGITTVSERLYLGTREALEKEGYTLVVAIEPLSIGRLIKDKKTKGRFDYVNSSESMRTIVPQQMELAINPNNLRIENSNLTLAHDQARMICELEKTLKGKLPAELRGLINMRTQSASVLAQLDLEYQEKTGKVFFADWYGRSDSETDYGIVVDVGRDYPTGRLRIGDWYDVDVRSFAVPAVMLPRRL